MYSLRQLLAIEKAFFQNNMLSKFRKSVMNCEHLILSRNHQNMNFSFCYYLLKDEPRIKDNEIYDKE